MMLMTLFQFSDELRWINTMMGVENLFGAAVPETGAAEDT
jgi:hypothetical protein